MLIRELSRQDSLDLVARSRLGRLACARGTMPYIVPFYFGYNDEYLYSFGTFGQKIEWMRTNPNVCVEIDEIVSPQQWVSVIIFGQFEEMPDLPEWCSAREYAHKKLLQRNPIWWEPAYARTIVGDAERQLAPCFYRIHIAQITGHRATPERVTPASTGPSRTAPIDGGWLRKIMRQVRKQG